MKKRQSNKRVFKERNHKNAPYDIIVPFTIEEDINFINKLVQILRLFQEFRKLIDVKINLELEELTKQMLILNSLIDITPKKEEQNMQSNTIVEKILRIAQKQRCYKLQHVIQVY